MSTLVSTTPFPALKGHEFMNLTTYRKSGVAVVTPVWFAESQGKLYVLTRPQAGKIKRIRHNSQVQVGPCTRSGEPLGPAVAAKARILPAAEIETAIEPLNKKYGVQKMFMDLLGRLRGGQTVYLEITRA